MNVLKYVKSNKDDLGNMASLWGKMNKTIFKACYRIPFRFGISGNLYANI